MNTIRPGSAAALFLVVLLGLPLVAMAEGEAEALSEPASEERPAGTAQLHRFLNGLNTLQANFQQVIENEGGGSESAVGTLYLQRPDRFRWDYRHPHQQQIVADGLSVWHYDPELEQVNVQLQLIALKGTPAKLLTSNAPPESDFVLTEQGERDGVAWVRLVPREEEPHFRVIDMGFADDLLQAMRMEDRFGQIVWFLFEEVERNRPIEASHFRFKPPESYDVFRY